MSTLSRGTRDKSPARGSVEFARSHPGTRAQEHEDICTSRPVGPYIGRNSGALI
jgi:hypothetical protein